MPMCNVNEGLTLFSKGLVSEILCFGSVSELNVFMLFGSVSLHIMESELCLSLLCFPGSWILIGV